MDPALHARVRGLCLEKLIELLLSTANAGAASSEGISGLGGSDGQEGETRTWEVASSLREEVSMADIAGKQLTGGGQEQETRCQLAIAEVVTFSVPQGACNTWAGNLVRKPSLIDAHLRRNERCGSHRTPASLLSVCPNPRPLPLLARAQRRLALIQLFFRSTPVLLLQTSVVVVCMRTLEPSSRVRNAHSVAQALTPPGVTGTRRKLIRVGTTTRHVQLAGARQRTRLSHLCCREAYPGAEP